MAQYDFGTINTATTSGADLATLLQNWRDALNSVHKGSTAPSYAAAGLIWIDDTNDPTEWLVKLYDGAAWITLGSIDPTNDEYVPYHKGTAVGSAVVRAAEVISKTANYTLVAADNGKVVLVDASSGAVTITLPAVASVDDGYETTVKKTDATANTVTLDGNASETIDGATTLVLSVEDESATLRGDQSAWYVVGDKIGGSFISQGKHSQWIPATAMTPRNSNGAAAGTAETTTNKVMLKTLDFNQSTQEYAQWFIRMPKSWNEGTVSVIPVWSHNGGSSYGVVWELRAVALSNDDAADAAFGTAQLSSDTGGTDDDVYIGPETAAISIGGTPAEGDFVVFQIGRKVADAGDTLNSDARLHGVLLLYTIDAEDDS
jgi:hypothetical protein